MGMEYRLEPLEDAWSIAPYECRTMLCSLPGYAGIRTTDEAFEFRGVDRTEGLPDLEARIEPAGIYLCDWGGDRALVQRVVGAIVLYCTVRLEHGVRLVSL